MGRLVLMRRSDRRRTMVAFAASVLVHAALIAWIGHEMQRLLPQLKHPPRVMDVVLLKRPTPSMQPPKDAQAIADRNARGGSKNANDRRFRRRRAPIVGNAVQPRPAPPAMPQRPPALPSEPATPRRLARRQPRAEPNPEQRRSAPPRPKAKAPSRPALNSLMPSAMALAELSRDFERERRLKQMLEREEDIPINTRKAKFAPYARELVRVLEAQWRPGQADYGRYDEAERRALIKLTINRDGSLAGVEILRPSPIPALNESAIAAIHAAAPFRPLPSVWGLDRVSFYLSFEVIDNRFVFRAL